MTFREEIIGDARLILGDCEAILPELGRFDCVVTDPPYGIDIGGAKAIGGANIVHPKEYGIHTWDKTGLTNAQWQAICGVTDYWIVWGGNHLANVLGASAGVLVWDKKCQNGWDDTFSDAEIAWTNVLTRAKAFRHRWVGAFRDSERGANVREHPTQKPIALMEWCLSFVPDAQTICDPFMGSGTTGAACARSQRKFTGIEREQKYFDIACKRIDAAYKQPRLFKEEIAKPVQINMLEDDAA